MEKKHLVLASGSPRRKELLSQLGYEFSVLVTDVEECKHTQETAEEYVKRLSLDKALAALSLLTTNPSEKQHVAPSSDTVVVSSDAISLDSEIYYVSSVPVYVDLYYIILLNIIIFIICFLVIILPSSLISNISPTKAIKYQ